MAAGTARCARATKLMLDFRSKRRGCYEARRGTPKSDAEGGAGCLDACASAPGSRPDPQYAGGGLGRDGRLRRPARTETGHDGNGERLSEQTAARRLPDIEEV